MKKEVGGIRKAGIAAVLLAVCICLVASFPLTASAADGKKTVLLLNAYHKGYKWTDELTAGVESIFKTEAAAAKYDLLVEYLDTKRVSGDEYFKQLSEVYKQRFANRKVDVIITSDDDALNFMLKYRDKTIPNTPVVFTGVNWYYEGRLGGQKGYTGVNEEADIKDNLDLIMKVHPDVRKIAVVVDTTTTGQRVKDIIQKAAPSYSDLVKFEYFDDFDMPQIIEKLRNLPGSSVVFHTIFARDKSGKFFEFSESAKMISDASPVPVYGLWDFNLGFGIVGGKLTSGFVQGSTAAELAMRVLNGENVDSIPVVMKSPNRYMFDYPQLDRFKIKPTMLPAESTFINKPKYTMTHILLGAIALLLVCVVVFIYKKVI